MKILFISNFVKTYSLVFKNELETLQKMGHEITWAANFNGFIGNPDEIIPFKIINIPTNSNPFKKSNIIAYRFLSTKMRESNYDAIICTTPIGGLIGRLLGKKHKIKIVIYSAHGFLFFKGFGLLKNLFFKTIGQLLALKTNHIITITKEDYNNAIKFKLKKGGTVNYIHGAGVDIDCFPTKSRETVRKELGFEDDDFLIVSAGALNKNKNNIVVIKAIRRLNNPRIKYIICGEGPLEQKLIKYVKKAKLEESIFFLGYRTDAIDIFGACDLFVMPSKREGVPRSLLEAMNIGLPCLGSRTRGITELIDPPFGGVVCSPNKVIEFSDSIKRFYNGDIDVLAISKRNMSETKKYSKEQVISELTDIYSRILK